MASVIASSVAAKARVVSRASRQAFAAAAAALRDASASNLRRSPRPTTSTRLAGALPAGTNTHWPTSPSNAS